MHTFVPPVAGRRRVFASKSAMAPTRELTCSLSSVAHSSRLTIYAHTYTSAWFNLMYTKPVYNTEKEGKRT